MYRDLSGKNAADALKKAFRDRVCKILRTDNAKDLISNEVKRLIEQKGVKHITGRPHTPTAQALVERANQTISRMIYRWMTMYKSRRVYPVLQTLVDNINTTVHNATKWAPASLFNVSERKILRDVRVGLRSKSVRHQPAGLFPELRPGDLVRVKLESIDAERAAQTKAGFSKGGWQRWSKEVFHVRKKRGGLYELQELPDKRFKRDELLRIDGVNSLEAQNVSASGAPRRKFRAATVERPMTRSQGAITQEKYKALVRANPG
jgi:Ni,Fe-hydrogenase III component G